MASAGSVTEEERTFVEEWENVATSTNYVIKLDFRGDTKPHMVQGPKKFKLTTYERILTEDQIHDPKLDPFKNGCFRPIMVPEGVDVETNPNALSDEDILRIFSASENAWEAYLDVIDSPETLQRMIRLAEDSEKLSLKRFRQIEGLVEQYVNAARPASQQKDVHLYDQVSASTGAIPTPAAPRRPGRPPKAVQA